VKKGSAKISSAFNAAAKTARAVFLGASLLALLWLTDQRTLPDSQTKPDRADPQKNEAPVKNTSEASRAARLIQGTQVFVDPTPVAEKRWTKEENARVQDCLRRQEDFMRNPVNRKAFESWLSRFENLRSQPLPVQLEVVNDSINQTIKYEHDIKIHKVEEHFAAPSESAVTLRIGDCEDYAILKYAVMRWLGVSSGRLCVASVASDSTKGGFDHGVLLVDLSPCGDGSEVVVLDNDGGTPMPLGETPYRPEFATTETGVKKIHRTFTGQKVSPFGWAP